MFSKKKYSKFVEIDLKLVIGKKKKQFGFKIDLKQ